MMLKRSTSGDVIVLGLSVEFGASVNDVIVEVPYGGTVEALAYALVAELPDLPPFVSLQVARTGQVLASSAAVGDCDLRSGDHVLLERSGAPLAIDAVSVRKASQPSEPLVRLRSQDRRHPQQPSAVTLRWPDGVVELPTGESTVGGGLWSDVEIPALDLPDLAFDVRVQDQAVAVRAMHDGPTLSVDGTAVADSWSQASDGSRIRVAGSVLEVVVKPVDSDNAPSRLIIGDTVDTRTKVDLGGGGRVDFNRPPRRTDPWRPARVELPSTPGPPRRVRLPLIAALVPLIGGLVMFLLLDSVLMLAFMALSPLMAAGTYLSDRRSGRHDHRERVAQFEQKLTAVADTLARTVATEAEQRRKQAPAPGILVETAVHRDSRLWERRPWDADFLALRVGVGRLPAMTNVTVERDHQSAAMPDPRVVAIQDSARTVDNVPYLVPLSDRHVLGLAGARPVTMDLARSLIVEAATLHSPADLGIAAAMPAGAEDGWEWLKWLPHTHTAAGVLEGFALGTGRRGIEVLHRIRDEQRARLEDHSERRFSGDSNTGGPALLVVIDEELQPDRSLVSEILSNAAALRTAVIWIGNDPRGLPGQCRITLDSRGDSTASASEVDTGLEYDPIHVDGLSTTQCERAARALAAVRDASTQSGSAAIPSRLRLLETLSLAAPSAEQLAERWQRPRLRLDATIGAAAGEPMHVDLRADGPHTLIAGTTGAGKSELLRTFVAALAAIHPPTRLTFLLIDYKGGAAFAPCAALPHVLDVVSDLDAELGERALISLDAEMKQRERLLADFRADNLIDLERRSPTVAPPNLVIMVDEFAKLREEIPDFVDGVVDIAQRGRTLGIHMVLAAQSLRTAFTPAVRANTNLRIALRVTSDSESDDVIDARDAARIPSGEAWRGRAFARLGHERLVEFQTAHVSGRYVDPRDAEVVARRFRFDSIMAPSIRRNSADDAPGSDETDLAALTRAAAGAAALLGLTGPRPAWTPPLAETLPRRSIQRHTDARAGICAIGLIDEPELQRQVPLLLELERGHTAIYGMSGTGKTTALQTVAAALAWDASPEDAQIYAIDAEAGALAVINPLPHVGAVIAGSDAERVERLLDQLTAEARGRAQRFAELGASTLTEFRERSEGQLPRIVLLVDGMGEFANLYDTARPGSPYERLLGLLASGRSVGIHCVVTADRRSAIRAAAGAHLSQRIVLRQATPEDLVSFGIPSRTAGQVQLGDGRAFTQDARVAQLALPTPALDVDLAEGFRVLAGHLSDTWPGISAPEILALPEYAPLEALVNGNAQSSARVIAGVGGPGLKPVTINLSERHFLISGPYGSGRSTALAAVASQVGRLAATREIHLLAPKRSPLVELGNWTSVARGAAACAELCQELSARLQETEETPESRVFLIVDDAGEIQDALAWAALEKVVRVGRDRGARVVAAAETSMARMITNVWLREIRRDGQGLLLMADPMSDGDLLGATLPRNAAVANVPGRGYVVERGRSTLVQVASPA